MLQEHSLIRGPLLGFSNMDSSSVRDHIPRDHLLTCLRQGKVSCVMMSCDEGLHPEDSQKERERRLPQEDEAG